MERTPKGVNVPSYVGPTPLMIHVMGLENARNRPATPQEMAEMQKLHREVMEVGACGFTVQVAGEISVQRDAAGAPMVTDTMAKEDLYALGVGLSELGWGFIQVTGPGIRTTENLAKAPGRPILWSNILPDMDQPFKQLGHKDRRMEWVKTANEEEKE